MDRLYSVEMIQGNVSDFLDTLALFHHITPYARNVTNTNTVELRFRASQEKHTDFYVLLHNAIGNGTIISYTEKKG